MTLDLYNFILDRIHEACPETMMLKFGCEVERIKFNEYDLGRWFVIAETSICKKHKKWREECYEQENGCSVDEGIEVIEDGEEDGFCVFSVRKDEIRILGTDPTLADVLRTIETKSNRKRNGDEWMVMSSGELRYVNVLRHEIKRNEATWNLSHDSLSWHRDNQPETIEFLYEILK